MMLRLQELVTGNDAAQTIHIAFLIYYKHTELEVSA